MNFKLPCARFFNKVTRIPVVVIVNIIFKWLSDLDIFCLMVGTGRLRNKLSIDYELDKSESADSQIARIYELRNHIHFDLIGVSLKNSLKSFSDFQAVLFHDELYGRQNCIEYGTLVRFFERCNPQDRKAAMMRFRSELDLDGALELCKKLLDADLLECYVQGETHILFDAYQLKDILTLKVEPQIPDGMSVSEYESRCRALYSVVSKYRSYHRPGIFGECPGMDLLLTDSRYRKLSEESLKLNMLWLRSMGEIPASNVMLLQLGSLESRVPTYFECDGILDIKAYAELSYRRDFLNCIKYLHSIGKRFHHETLRDKFMELWSITLHSQTLEGDRDYAITMLETMGLKRKSSCYVEFLKGRNVEEVGQLIRHKFPFPFTKDSYDAIMVLMKTSYKGEETRINAILKILTDSGLIEIPKD